MGVKIVKKCNVIYGLYIHSPSFSGFPTRMTNIDFCHLLVWRVFSPLTRVPLTFGPEVDNVRQHHSPLLSLLVSVWCVCAFT